MRDGNRLKEKIELRLERRQVVSFVMVALVLAGAVFALGVLVGKNLATMPGRNPPAPETLLDRLDARASAASDGGDGLTFQEELTRPAQPEPSPPKKKRVEASPRASDKGQGPLSRIAEAVVAPDAGAAVASAPGTKIAQHPVPASREEEGGKDAAAIFFTVQVKSTQSKAEAARFTQKLAGQGYHPFVAEVDLPGKGRWYRVRLGKFESRAKADGYLADFERETRLAAFVTVAGH